MSEPGAPPDEQPWSLYVVPGLFAVLGGAIGGLALWLALAVGLVLSPWTGFAPAESLGALLVMLVMLTVIGGFVGFPSALAAGALAALLLRTRPRRVVFVPACAVLGGLCATVQALVIDWSIPLMACPGVVSGGVCAHLTLKLMGNEAPVRP